MIRTISALVLCAALPVAGYSQTHRPTDREILIKVSRTLANEQAFNGMTIIPSVSHGVVTLTGTVTSYAAKVLASTEISGINGIKTVLNNLNVVPAGSNAQTSAPAPAPPPASQELPPPPPSTQEYTSMQTVNLPADTSLPVRLVEGINTKNAQANDVFHATLLSDITANDFVLIPHDTVFIGRVISAQSAGRFTGYPELSLELTGFILNTPNGPDRIGLITNPLSSKGKGRGKNTAEKAGGGAALGAIIGALAGGGEGAAIGALAGGGLGAGTNIRRGQEIDLKPEQLLTFKTNSAASVPVYLDSGSQIIPNPATMTEVSNQHPPNANNPNNSNYPNNQ
ncbi:MAG TPA: BON domain-containing protein [Acidobacteriaceae bacterium]|nr:BON domain-containing protein [Acidobacteriaceae bacterium]